MELWIGRKMAFVDLRDVEVENKRNGRREFASVSPGLGKLFLLGWIIAEKRIHWLSDIVTNSGPGKTKSSLGDTLSQGNNPTVIKWHFC